MEYESDWELGRSRINTRRISADERIEQRARWIQNPRTYSRDDYIKSGPTTLISSPLIEVRGNMLIQTHPEIADKFKNSPYRLERLARKYVRDDFKISPETAMRMIEYALDRLVSESNETPLSKPAKVKKPKEKRALAVA